MSSRGDISGQYIPENDISGQATRNAFRESPEMSFLVKKNYQRNVTSGEEISRNVISCKDFFYISKVGPMWMKSDCWVRHSLLAF